MAVAELAETTASPEISSENPANTFNMDRMITSFFVNMEERFLDEYMSANIVELFHQEIENIPEFFIQHYKQNIAKKLID